MLEGKRILLIVSGGIAAYKCPDLVRRLRQRGANVRCVLTAGSAEFVTALTLGAVSEDKVFQDLFSLTDEEEMGHIRLSREADLVLVAPATANILAKMAAGIADDLATTALMATDKPILVAPAMNVRMWENPATQENLATLEKRGIGFIGPEEGDMACGEWGLGRMSEPDQIAAAVEDFFRQGLPLSGQRALVTSGPTHEAIDPVRYLANRSSGKQGHAIAGALARLGSQTTLISGPSHQPDPSGVEVVKVLTARQMLAACEQALPVDIAVLAAAVTDWRAETVAKEKIKKTGPKKGTQTGSGGKPRYPGDAQRQRQPEAAPGSRFRRRNRRRHRQCDEKACGQRLRLDGRQRRVAGNWHLRGRYQHCAFDHRGRGRGLADPVQDRRRRAPGAKGCRRPRGGVIGLRHEH